MNEVSIRWTIEIDHGTVDAETWGDTLTVSDRGDKALLGKAALLIGIAIADLLRRELLSGARGALGRINHFRFG